MRNAPSAPSKNFKLDLLLQLKKKKANKKTPLDYLDLFTNVLVVASNFRLSKL
jgi:hypothetical protein